MQNQDREFDIADLKAEVKADKAAKRNAALDPRDPEYVDEGDDCEAVEGAPDGVDPQYGTFDMSSRTTNGAGFVIQQRDIPKPGEIPERFKAIGREFFSFNAARAAMLRMPVDGSKERQVRERLAA